MPNSLQLPSFLLSLIEKRFGSERRANDRRETAESVEAAAADQRILQAECDRRSAADRRNLENRRSNND